MRKAIDSYKFVLAILAVCATTNLAFTSLCNRHHLKKAATHNFRFSLSGSPEPKSSVNFIREVGGYERLLSRKTPGTNTVSLSHGTAFIFDGFVANELLLDAVEKCMDRHPVLRAYISRDEEVGKEYWSYCERSTSILAREVISTVEVPDHEFDVSWKADLQNSINDAAFPETGPLWRMKNVVSESPSSKRSAWVFCFNHGTDDQQSVNIIVKDLLEYIYSNDKGIENNDLSTEIKEGHAPMKNGFAFPKCVEDAIAPEVPSWKTFKWSIFQLQNQAASAMILPSILRIQEKYLNPDNRSTFLEYFNLTKEETTALRLACRSNGVTITMALSAAILCLTSSFFQNNVDENGVQEALVTKKLRFLLSVGLRSYGMPDMTDTVPSVISSTSNDKEMTQDKKNSAMGDWTGGTVACASGAVDFVVPVPGSITNETRNIYDKLKMSNGWGFDTNVALDKEAWVDFWTIAKSCKEKAKDVIEGENFIPESVRLFGLGMKYVDILKVVEEEARSPVTIGRGYSCGVSNVGIADLPKIPLGSSNNFRVVEAYYGTSHARNGVYCLLSSITIEDSLCGCLQFTSPLISVEDAKLFKDCLVEIIRGIV